MRVTQPPSSLLFNQTTIVIDYFSVQVTVLPTAVPSVHERRYCRQTYILRLMSNVPPALCLENVRKTGGSRRSDF